MQSTIIGRRVEKSFLNGLAAIAVIALTALAQTARAGDCEEPPPGFWERDTLLGTFDRARTDLCKKGVQLGATYTGEFLDNRRGGLRQGHKIQGRTEFDLDLDFEQMLDSKGTTMHAAVMWIHGGRMTGKNIGNLMSVSNIEAIPAVRLHTLWGQQELFDETLSLRLGQLAIDDEFVTSKLSSVFVNSTFGFPFLISGSLPSGGPAYPLPTPGARIKVEANDRVSLMGAAFGGDPAGKFGKLGAQDAQRRNPHGTEFSLSRGKLYIGEGTYALNQEKNDKGLPGTYKLGAWYHSGHFNDQHYDVTGLSLADPNTRGNGKPLAGNYGVYMVAEQMLIKGQRWSDEGFGVFLRAGASPANRNQVSHYADGGVSYKGLFKNREEDTLALGVGYAPISEALRDLDKDTRRFNGTLAQPVRDYETIIELTYQAQITPWWTLQPDIQYVVHPGGNIPNPRKNNLVPIDDAIVFGLRTSIKF